jgi:hypothetical protein
MENVNSSEFLWTEKYRPKTIEDCVLPSNLKSLLSKVISGGDVPNLLLAGGAGQGKCLGYESEIVFDVPKSVIDVLNEKNIHFVPVTGENAYK